MAFFRPLRPPAALPAHDGAGTDSQGGMGRHPAEVGGVLDENLRHAPEQVFLPGAGLRHAGPPHRLQSVQAAGLFFHQHFHHSPDAGTGVRVLRGDG